MLGLAARRLSTAASKVPVAVCMGDGIGPEIAAATLRILEAANARIDPIKVDMGLDVYERGVSTGISESAWDTIHQTKLLLKAPITTPKGGGVKSLNVTLRKSLGLFANVRPCVSYHPYVPSHFPNTNLVCVRENEEDTYGGIEHRQTAEVTQCLKLITIPGSERLIRYAFEYALASKRKKVTCITKSNIHKLTDGTFERIFHDVAREYPRINAQHMIVDIGAAKLAADPESFDVIVCPNLYGDILSDIAAEVVGSVGLAGSANIGSEYALFEAIHGSAPDIAGTGRANPSGMIAASTKLLAHIGDLEACETIHRAWLRTIEDGVHTADVFTKGLSSRLASTDEFADAVIERLGTGPQVLEARAFGRAVVESVVAKEKKPKKRMVGVDVFVDWDLPGRKPSKLAEQVNKAVEGLGVKLMIISNRGTVVWPGRVPATMRVDHWRLRFKSDSEVFAKDTTPGVDHAKVLEIMDRIVASGLDVIKHETLAEFDDVAGYSKAQGE
eukprot:TRINITY_DN1447_c0_g2_i2.p1 TRINITY_DN1447_c0_g2~~TRINITY_DN1447_c0_g2_i2.p1  ORF type:complete len:501 (+),score=219.06 TRINITY_DN1447_c0_g2_i2:83-1585(+)